MASTTRTLTANFVGRTSNLEKSFKRVAKGSSLMSEKLMRATRVAGIGFGALAGAAIGAAVALKPMIDKAASMEEALSKNQLLLGESAKAVEAFADTSLESFGITNLAALQATGVFASLGDAMGMSEEASASMATTLTGLAGDLSSLHDVSVETALTALRAGLIGEAEPLRKLGILLDAATIKNKALSMGLIKNTRDALTPAIKSQAAYALIMEKGATAMGDFTRTADSATNVSKRLVGSWDEVQIQIGTALLPAFTALVTHLVEEVMPAIEEFFEDPSWAAMGKLSAEALTSEFSKTIGEFFLGAAGFILSPLGFGLNLAADKLGVLGYFAGNDVGEGFNIGLSEALLVGGSLNPDWDRGDWEEAGAAAGEAFYGAAGAMAPGPGFPPFGPELPPAGPMVPSPGFPPFDPVVPPAGPMAPGPGLLPGKPVLPPAGPMAPGPGLLPDKPGFGGGFTMDPGQRGVSADTGGPTKDAILAWLGTSGAQKMLGQGPPNIIINSTAVSGPELIDEMGKYVEMNGPLARQWFEG